jgi:hypothetical protein
MGSLQAADPKGNFCSPGIWATAISPLLMAGYELPAGLFTALSTEIVKKRQTGFAGGELTSVSSIPV